MDLSANLSGSNAGRGELSDLLGAVAAGSPHALRSVYERTSAKLFGICVRLLGDRGEAEDVLQEVYLTVWRKADRFDPAMASPITWLAVLTRNRAIDRLRQRRPANDTIDAAEGIADDGPSPLDLVTSSNDRDRLARCLAELEERPRGLIRAAFLDGATYSELAEREAVPLGTMKSWIRRGLQRLRGCLER